MSSVALSHSPADILSRAMIAMGLASDPEPAPTGAWPAYVSSEPSSPDNCLTVYDTDRQSDGRAMVDGEEFHHYGVQIRVRSVDFRTGYVKADALHTVLTEGLYQEAITIDGHAYNIAAVCKTSVRSLGRDSTSTKRSLFTVNAILALEVLS